MSASRLPFGVLTLLHEALDATSSRVWPGPGRSRAALAAESLGLLGYAGTGGYAITALGQAAIQHQQAALLGVATVAGGDKSREEPISTPPPPTDGEVK